MSLSRRFRLHKKSSSAEDRVQLINEEPVDPVARLPPEWVSVVDELQYELSR